MQTKEKKEKRPATAARPQSSCSLAELLVAWCFTWSIREEAVVLGGMYRVHRDVPPVCKVQDSTWAILQWAFTIICFRPTAVSVLHQHLNACSKTILGNGKQCF